MPVCPSSSDLHGCGEAVTRELSFARLGAERSEQFRAGLLAAAAGLGADTAVLVMGCVLLALLGAEAACPQAGFEQAPRQPRFGARLSRQHLSGGVADVGAVEAQSNAVTQLLDVLLREVGVSARRAIDEAGETLLDAAHERFAWLPLRMGGEQLGYVVHVRLLSTLSGVVT
jgi:hypothetical protein